MRCSGLLTPDGTLWLNIGDCYAGSGKGAGDWDKKGRSSSKHRYLYALDNPAAQLPKRWPDIKPKDLIGIPWALAFSLRSDGWYLRSDIIWHKPNCMPHPVKDRPVNSYEHVFLLAKSKKYFFRLYRTGSSACAGKRRAIPARFLFNKIYGYCWQCAGAIPAGHHPSSKRRSCSCRPAWA